MDTVAEKPPCWLMQAACRWPCSPVVAFNANADTAIAFHVKADTEVAFHASPDEVVAFHASADTVVAFHVPLMLIQLLPFTAGNWESMHEGSSITQRS